MSRVTVVACLLMFGCLLVAGCGGPDEPPATEQEGTRVEPEHLDEETAAAAQTRGVPTEETDEKLEGAVRVVLTELSFEWRDAPEKGLHVVMEFGNPLGGNTRARGYVFLVAQSMMPGREVTGVYPWDTVLDDEKGMPVTVADGTHLLYRDRQQVRAFVPYRWDNGYYETLRLLVFHEDGRLIINRSYDLGLTGTPGETRSMEVNPDFDL